MGCSANTRALVAARMGYNGQLHEPFGAWQALGNGHRIYNPVLMRFHSADDESPFARGGINAYAYCGLDPINHADQDGRGRFKIMALGLVFTGLTGALAAARNLVHPEDKTTQTILTIATIATGLTAASIGGYYFTTKFMKSRATSVSQQSTPGMPIDPTAPPLTPVGALPSPGSMRRVTFVDPVPQRPITFGSTALNRRKSEPVIGQNRGRRQSTLGRPDAPSQFALESPFTRVAMGNKNIRKASFVTTGWGRKSGTSSGQGVKVQKSAYVRKQSTSSYYGKAF